MALPNKYQRSDDLIGWLALLWDQITADETSITTLQGRAPTLGTVQVTTSGTSIDFNIPSWATQITVGLSGVSTNGTSSLILRLGDVTSFEATVYMGSLGELTDATAVVATTFATSFLLATNNAAARARSGAVTLTLLDPSTNTWTSTINIGSDNTRTYGGGGDKSLTGALTRVRLTTVNGTDAFDAGKVNVRYS